MYRPRTLCSAAVLAAALLLAGMGAANAQTIFTVSLNTSSLIGNANAPFSLDFQLNDGSGTNDGNNTATLSNFNFGGGAATGVPTLTGGAAGDLTSGITLTDSSFFNEAFQSFTPGNTLSFDVSLTGNPDAGPTPDQFSFAILDNTLSEISTTGTGAFLTADINGPTPDIQTFSGSGSYAPIGSPTVTLAAPEPGSLTMVGLGLLAGTFFFCYRKG